MRSFIGRDILTLKDFSREDFFRVFEVGNQLRPHAANRRNTDLLRHKTLLTAFYQPSTRTRLSTEAAMHRLGGAVLGFSDAKMTRAGDFYQESLKDTFRMLESYADVIAIRHFTEGAPAEAAKDAGPAPAVHQPAAPVPPPQSATTAQPKSVAPVPARRAPPTPVQTAAPAGGTIQLAILPWGEVFVNGKSRGVSPPLRSIGVPPGTHTIEVRNTSFPTHTRRVEVRASEPVRIRHRFR